VRDALRWDGSPSNAARITRVKFHRLMFGDVFRLRGFQALKPRPIAIDDIEAVAHLSQPKVQVGNMTSSLVSVERGELRELVSEYLRDVGGVRHVDKDEKPTDSLALRGLFGYVCDQWLVAPTRTIAGRLVATRFWGRSRCGVVTFLLLRLGPRFANGLVI